MNTGDDIDEPAGGKTLVAEFVLGLLSQAEHQRVARLIEADPALAGERRFWEQRLAALDADFAEVTAPNGIYGDIEKRLFGPVRSNRFAIVWDSLLLWRGLAAGALAVAVVTIGMNLSQLSTVPGGQLVALLAADGSGVKFVALYEVQSGIVKLTSLSGDAVPGHDYELWAIQGNDKPVSMGVVPLNAGTAVTLPPEILQHWGPGSVLAITLEPSGGSPSGDPTGPVVAKGAVTQI